VFELATIAVPCPNCGCPIATSLSRVICGAGVFCPACQVHITFADERASIAEADRKVAQAVQSLSRTIEVEFKL
jgi:uncharacterized Zn finger protein (UPF0148 family)